MIGVPVTRQALIMANRFCTAFKPDKTPIAAVDGSANLPTTAGSRVLKDAEPASRDADVVRALAGAGMVGVGRVNMSEFAFSGLGINPHYGTPRNPASPAGEHRIPGELLVPYPFMLECVWIAHH